MISATKDLPVVPRIALAAAFLLWFAGENASAQTIRYREHGEILQLNVKRGLYEPSIIKYQGRYFLTMRNDLRAYVTVSEDGLNNRAGMCRRWRRQTYLERTREST